MWISGHFGRAQPPYLNGARGRVLIHCHGLNKKTPGLRCFESTHLGRGNSKFHQNMFYFHPDPWGFMIQMDLPPTSRFKPRRLLIQRSLGWSGLRFPRELTIPKRSWLKSFGTPWKFNSSPLKNGWLVQTILLPFGFRSLFSGELLVSVAITCWYPSWRSLDHPKKVTVSIIW